MGVEQEERLQNELALLEAMYPEQISFSEKAREVRYESSQGAFQLRLPDGYLADSLPEVLHASAARQDLREPLRQRIQTCSVGDEVLDAIISAFSELCETNNVAHASESGNEGTTGRDLDDQVKATVIVWLHHLLNTNKRKQSLSPAGQVSGLTKPGYPGVLVYSGPKPAVQEHVNDLKQLNWQAFQVRLETDDAWTFHHGSNVKEVETMKELVADLAEEHRDEFLAAMRII